VEDLINALRDAVDHGTGQAVRSTFGLRADLAGKTGTTQNNTDGWFILMHPRLVAGAWVGFNDSRVTMRSDHWGGGGQNALLLVGDFFRQALEARLIDGRTGFPYARPEEFALEPYLDAAREWFFGTIKDWLFGERAKPAPVAPPPRRELQRERFDEAEDRRERQRLERQSEKEQLMERLRQRREQWAQDYR
jgi:penicillin-binding protein 1A